MNCNPIPRNKIVRPVTGHSRKLLIGQLGAALVLLASASGAQAQAVYPTPEATASAFVDALSSNDPQALRHVLGSDYLRFIPAKSVDKDDLYDFLGAWSQKHEIVSDSGQEGGHQVAHLAVGDSGWLLPIPIIKTDKGWRFDPRAGREEILTRRVGRNERAAMLTSLAYLDAQQEYHQQMSHYAQRFVSTPGQRDGLYWSPKPGEQQSPLGPLAAVMSQSSEIAKDGYHGYHYKILTAQGPHAKGGARNYLQDGVLLNGYALVAWPVDYASTGVMSFMVNQEGQIYEKDLGPQGAHIARTLAKFDPDSSWSMVRP
ncbi:DUF2950 domain-containing protein [Paraburkholderia sp. HD33-4]|uniref:DUF2950 domain-containing protein n=1 Tax=Paraburkholderia sp. HD33-4 TaxID=2883242 RepID=UPI001F1778B1|nr:DUF2950 domain-containing protein [Paraburkholderia sp. HD33-4]